MNSPSTNQIIYSIPITLFAHQLEEYLGHFPEWYSNLLNTQLSTDDFIYINSIGLTIIIGLAVTSVVNANFQIPVALGTLIFVNGIIHLLITIFTLSYSPGTITGVVFFIPLGLLIYKKLLPLLTPTEQLIAISSGIAGLICVSIIAFNI